MSQQDIFSVSAKGICNINHNMSWKLIISHINDRPINHINDILVPIYHLNIRSINHNNILDLIDLGSVR